MLSVYCPVALYMYVLYIIIYSIWTPMPDNKRIVIIINLPGLYAGGIFISLYAKWPIFVSKYLEVKPFCFSSDDTCEFVRNSDLIWCTRL